MPRLKHVVVDLRVTGHVRPIWVCRDCGAEAVGERVSVEFEAEPLVPITSQLGRLDYTFSAMPVGWAAYGSDGVRCPKCVK